MRALALFRPSFQRLQKVISLGEQLRKQILPQCRNRLDFERMDRTLFALNSIDHVAVDLQSPEVDLELQKFELLLDQLKMTAYYDYKAKQFRLIRNQNNEPISKPLVTGKQSNEKNSVSAVLSRGIQEVELGVRSAWVEKVDHPILRESLYFSELKEIDQYVKIKYPRNAPRFIKDMIRRNTENDVLDKQNPLGLPVKAPPLQILMTLNRSFTAELICRFGYINLNSVRGIKNPEDVSSSTCSYYINGMNIPRPIQKLFFSLCQEQVGLKQPELYILHKMAYVGGRVEELEMLMGLFRTYSEAFEEE